MIIHLMLLMFLMYPSDAIFGGNDVDFELFEREYSFFVSILHKKPHQVPSDLICGGILLGPKVVATSAHCLRKQKKYKNFFVVVGSNERMIGQLYGIENFYKHSSYKSIEKGYDAAVIILKDPVEYENLPFVKFPIAMAQLPTGTIAVGQKCTFLGHGATGINNGTYLFSDLLQIAHWPKIDIQKCIKYIEEREERRVNNPPLLCIGYVYGRRVANGCVGDSGSPFICKRNNHYELYGIFSWGYDCDESGAPNGFADITNPSVRSFFEHFIRLYGEEF
uniref:Peptidase S1 domain-containing protein n=1 Tax=Panagrolaimus davidi TaxID=227884 RepID=A0A914QVW1_9BILA